MNPLWNLGWYVPPTTEPVDESFLPLVVVRGVVFVTCAVEAEGLVVVFGVTAVAATAVAAAGFVTDVAGLGAVVGEIVGFGVL